MADNTDEEHLDNPTNNQSENSSDEIIPTTDTEAHFSNFYPSMFTQSLYRRIP